MSARDISLASTPRERTLFERIGTRDVRALSELYDCYSPLIYGLVLRIVGDAHGAEDVLQQVFAAAWNQADVHDTAHDSPAEWLVRTARVLALAHVRTRLAAFANHASASGAAHAAPADRDSRARPAAGVLGALACEQRQLIEDAYFLGLTQSQLAARHQMPIETVKAHIRTGLLTLRQQLSPKTHES